MTHAIRSLRERFNKKSAALLFAFVIALSGTGIASLAVLTDTVTTTVNASVTTIDLTVNGTKSATINLAAGIPGDIRFASLAFHNAGTGYVNLPTVTNVLTGAGQLLNDSTVEVWTNFGPNNGTNSCDATGITADYGTSSGLRAAKAVNLQLYPDVTGIQVPAGTSYDICLRYRLGTTGATYTDGISAWSLRYDFPAYYP